MSDSTPARPEPSAGAMQPRCPVRSPALGRYCIYDVDHSGGHLSIDEFGREFRWPASPSAASGTTRKSLTRAEAIALAQSAKPPYTEPCPDDPPCDECLERAMDAPAPLARETETPGTDAMNLQEIRFLTDQNFHGFSASTVRALVTEIARLRAASSQRVVVAAELRGADRLAATVCRIIDRGWLDARSEAGDALLDYATDRFGTDDPIGALRKSFAAPTPTADHQE